LGEWQSPIPLDVVFDSPSVNWSYSSFTSSRHPVLGQKSLIDQSAELDIIHFDRLSVDSTFGSSSWNPKKGKKWTKGFEKRDIAYASKWIKVISTFVAFSVAEETDRLLNRTVLHESRNDLSFIRLQTPPEERQSIGTRAFDHFRLHQSIPFQT